MKTVLLLLTVNLSGAVAAGPRGQSGDERHLQELIDRLTDDDIGVREKAASDLAEFGKTAIPTLEKARGSTDIPIPALLLVVAALAVPTVHQHPAS